jgi:two-component system, NtrC family, nitrogen regulation sensor histidine kinase NtrY
MSQKKNISFYFFIASFLLLLAAELKEYLGDKNEKQIINSAQEHLQSLELQMQQSLAEISKFNSEEQFHRHFIHRGFQKKGFSFFYYNNKELIRWSDNETEIPASFSDSLDNNSLVHLSNGWYEVFTKSFNGKKVTGLLLIKKEYPFENNYLVSHFNPSLHLPERAQLSMTNGDAFPVQSISGKTLFSITLNPKSLAPEKFSANAWLELSAYLAFLFAVFFFFVQRTGFRFIHLIGIAMLLFLLRFVMISKDVPYELYATGFFSPKYYGSSYFFNSTGDLLLNTITFFLVSVLVFVYSGRAKGTSTTSLQKAIFIPALAGIILFLVAIHRFIAGLIINSKISFDVNTLLNMDGYSMAAIASIMLLLWSIVFLLLSSASIVNRKIKITSNTGTVFVFLFAAYAALTIRYYQSVKEKEERRLFAQRLDMRQDHLAEYLFEDEEKKISNDAVIRQIFASEKKVNESVNKRLQQFFFRGYLNKFDVNATCYGAGGIPYDTASPSLDYFNNLIKTQGRTTYSDKLFFLANETGRLNYLALLPIVQPDSISPGTIVFRLEAKLMQLAEGFPDLLVSNRVQRSEAETNYSFARYNNGSLIHAYGPFPYSFSSTAFNNAADDFTFRNYEGYDHLVYRASPTALIVVSKPTESSFTLVSLFSYLLFFFSIFYFITWLCIQLAQGKITWPFNLKQRIRSSILALVLLSFVLIGAGTIYYITHKYKQDLNKNILARLYSLWFSLRDNLNLENNLSDAGKESWQINLNDVGNSLGLDFNVYDERGSLFYSSQPKVFEEGIVAARMDPKALFEMNFNGRTQYVHPENIGTLKYISAYSPLTNRAGIITGYVNLPYLEKQNELEKEISGFLSALITIYMLLLALAVFIALVISSRITQPLLLIQEKLGNIALGRRNEAIEWNSRDEIGELVREYNRMIGELAISAEKLSRSERESAWREMAKQVAHEIKNPLTPMKLHLQHLQRSLKESNEEEMRAAVERTNKMLIEQIDNLSSIATEFSNFANMPRTKNESLSLRDIITSALNLFSTTPGITILFPDDGKERKVLADRKQMVRLFSNLIKNAVQAIPPDRQGRINVNAETHNGFHRVSVSDNGTGIPAEQRLKIFTPSFTTKTSGMGLGLAIVKSSVEQAGGKVWFETKEGEGTTFFVELPIE